MADISAKDVAALRKITGAGMMDCKKALLENDGDFERAKDWLREKGIAGAAKREGRAADHSASANPLRAKPPHHEAKAKSLIFLFMVGGPSPIDLFDPKPELLKHQGKPLPESFGKPVSQFTNCMLTR